MSNVIDFLEKMGRDANLRYATTDEVLNALVSEGIEPSLGRSMLNAETRSSLEARLGAKPNVCCGIAPATYEEDGGTMTPDSIISRRAATAR